MTPQQQALLQKAARSIQSAIGQNETGFPEFAASRAYYAMFYMASAFLEGGGIHSLLRRVSTSSCVWGSRFRRATGVTTNLSDLK